MTKKLLPMMIGTALAGGMTAAMADVTVFGHLDTSVDYVDPNSSLIDDDTNLNCNTCSIGFKGSEDLGNGLKAIFKIDFQYDSTERNTGRASASSATSPPLLTTGGGTTTLTAVTSVSDTSSITDRDQWLGLAGGFGQVRIGTISTVYKSHGAMIDPLYRTSLQGRSRGLQLARLQSGAGEEIQGRATNTFRYDSPDFNGFKVGATYTLDNSEGDGEDDNPYGIGASYSNGGILAFADYITNDGGSTNAAGDLSAWKVGGKYTLNNFAVMGQYEDLSNDNTGATDTTQWTLGGTYTMGNNLIYAAYGANNLEPDSGALNDVDTDAYTIALMHSLSKRTKVYAGYNNQDNDGGEPGVAGDLDRDQWSLGMKHKF